ncbi:hypothetical protein AAMO2058_001261500 [Amorphochlora amoebiformis]
MSAPAAAEEEPIIAEPVAYGAHPVVAHPVEEGPGDGRWPTHLFGCFDNIMPSCLMASFFWCFPLSRVRVSAQIENPSIGGCPSDSWMRNIILTFSIYILINVFSVLEDKVHPAASAGSVFVGVGLIFFVFVTRMEYRRKRNIRDNCCCCEDTCWDDIFSSLFCTCCTIAQLDRTEFRYAGALEPCCFEACSEPEARGQHIV